MTGKIYKVFPFHLDIPDKYYTGEEYHNKIEPGQAGSYVFDALDEVKEFFDEDWNLIDE